MRILWLAVINIAVLMIVFFGAYWYWSVELAEAYQRGEAVTTDSRAIAVPITYAVLFAGLCLLLIDAALVVYWSLQKRHATRNRVVSSDRVR